MKIFIRLFPLIISVVLVSVGTAQRIALADIGGGVWLDGVHTNSGFVGLVADSTGKKWMVKQDSATYLSSDAFSRLAYDGDVLIATSQPRQISSQVYTGKTDRVVDINTGDLLPGLTVGNWGHPSYGQSHISDALAPAVGEAPFYLAQRWYAGRSGHFSIGTVVNSDFLRTVYNPRGWVEGQDATKFIGALIARNGDRILSVGLNPAANTQAVAREDGVAFAWRVMTPSGDPVNTETSELRGYPVNAAAWSGGFLLATTREIVVLDADGNVEYLHSFSANMSLQSLCEDRSGNGAYAILKNSNTSLLVHVDAIAGIDQVFGTASVASSLQQVYFNEAKGYRLEAKCGATLCYEDELTEITASALLAALPLSSVSSSSVSTYPLTDTLNNSVSFAHMEQYDGTISQTTFAAFTTDGNVFIQFDDELSLRAKSGQFLGDLSDVPPLDTVATPVSYASRVVSSSDSVSMRTVTGDRLIYEVEDVPGFSTSIFNTYVLPRGYIMLRVGSGSFRTNTEYSHIVIDTLGRQITNLGGNSFTPIISDQGIILSGTRNFSYHASSYRNTVSGYHVIPYEALERPIDLPFQLTRCTTADEVSFTNPTTGEIQTAVIGLNNMVSINGISYVVDRTLPASLANIEDSISQIPYCGVPGELGRVLLDFNDPDAIQSALINGMPVEDFTFDSDTRFIVTIVDTSGCTLSVQRETIYDRLFVRSQPSCFGENGGVINTASTDTILLNGIKYEGRTDTLPYGTYNVTLISSMSSCTLQDTLVEVEQIPELQISTSFTALGDSFLVEAVNLDTSRTLLFFWSNGSDVSSTVVAQGDTVILSYRLDTFRPFSCEQFDTIVAPLIVDVLDVSAIQFEVYPNPLRTSCTIKVNTSANLLLYDDLGRVLEQYALNPGVNELDMSSYPQGNYLLRIQDGDKALIHKLIKIE